METSQRVWNAAHLAIEWHGLDCRKGRIGGYTLLYVSHTMSVMKRAYVVGAGTDLIMCGCLGHDLLEDTKITWDLIRNALGEDIANLIKELTFVSGTMTKEEYLKTFEKSSVPALLIKVLDRIDNIWDFLSTDPQYAVKYFHKADVLWGIWEKRSAEIDEYFLRLLHAEPKGTVRSRVSDMICDMENAVFP